MSIISKHICDICGTEIISYSDRWEFNIKEQRKVCGFKYRRPNWSTDKVFELCRECGDALESFIGQRKKEFDNVDQV